MKEIKRGQLYYADLWPVIGSEQGGVRPVLILQNDVGNKYSPTAIFAPITAKKEKHRSLTHMQLKWVAGLAKDSIILPEQFQAIDKELLKYLAANLECKTM